MENLIVFCYFSTDSSVVLYGPRTFVIDPDPVLVCNGKEEFEERKFTVFIEIFYNGCHNAFVRTSVEVDFGMVT